jgi:pyruvate/2-oxoglutarate dehydrogenase complex dihydrolipoamide dehydrogenase (E3) component
MSGVLRTRTLSESRGYLKALVGTNDHIIGFTAFGVSAGEIMGAVQIAMIAGLSYTALRDAILGVPTPNVKNRTLRNLDHSFETAKGRRGLNEPLRSFPAACQV